MPCIKTPNKFFPAITKSDAKKKNKYIILEWTKSRDRDRTSKQEDRYFLKKLLKVV